jgi:hypothetical protein
MEGFEQHLKKAPDAKPTYYNVTYPTPMSLTCWTGANRKDAMNFNLRQI